MMLYHNDRLINMYLRVGFQLSGDSRGVGVIGVVCLISCPSKLFPAIMSIV